MNPPPLMFPAGSSSIAVGLVLLGAVWMSGRELRRFLAIRKRAAATQRLFSTYMCIENSIRGIRAEAPIAEDILLSGKVMSKSRPESSMRQALQTLSNGMRR